MDFRSKTLVRTTMNWKVPNNFQLNATENPWKKNFSVYINKLMGTKETFSWQLLQRWVSSRKETQDTTLPWHRNTLHQCCTSAAPAQRQDLAAQLLMPVWNQQNEEHPPETGRCLVLPGLGRASSGHKSIPKPQGANSLMCRISKGFCFVSNALCLPPAPSSEASHSWAGLSTARVLLQEHNPAASSCCFPEQVTTSRRGWKKMKGPGYFFNTHTHTYTEKTVRFSLNKQTKLNQNNYTKLWEELTEKREEDYTESFKLLGKKPFLPVAHSSKTAYECFTITSLNSDIFSLLGCIMNISTSTAVCSYWSVRRNVLKYKFSALKVEFSRERQTMNKQVSPVNMKRLRRLNCSQFQSFPCCLRTIINSPREAIHPFTSYPVPVEPAPIPPQTFAENWTH